MVSCDLFDYSPGSSPQIAQILWTVAIACVLYDVTVNLRMYHSHEQSRLMRRFHAAVWGTALVTMLLPFTTNSYGNTGAWCWIKASNKEEFDVGTMWRYLLLYIPVWLGGFPDSTGVGGVAGKVNAKGISRWAIFFQG